MRKDQLEIILETFIKNRFDPKNETEIPTSSGNYILCLRTQCNLPSRRILPTFKLLDDHRVIYTGVASGSLHDRDYKQHFTGNNAGRSTLRKSLGVLFGYKQIARDRDPNSRKTKFSATDERKLSEWMKENLILYFLPTTNYEKLEPILIDHFNPPLNLKGNHNRINQEFRRRLSDLRGKKSENNF